MIRSAITISLVEEARGGPFVFWGDVEAAIRRAAELGYDAVELFAPGPAAVDVPHVRKLLADHGLRMAAVGTGAGWVIHKRQLCDADPSARRAAREFIRSLIDFGGAFEAPAIIGSMQGRWQGQVTKPAALDMLLEALGELGDHARQYGVPLIYEPLNRYETNLCNTQREGVELLEKHAGINVRLLADLFHMNIEEESLAHGLREGGRRIGHVHFVDSNRRPAGLGHIDFQPVAAALREIEYAGYASAEAFPHPDSETAAAQTIDTFRRTFR